MKIVFAGTPEIARLCLLSILDAGFNVELVLTQPDRPAGRGMKLTSSPVKELALERGIEVFQPATFKQNPDALAKIKVINPDIIVVVAYGLILPQELLDIPRLGCVNVHVSLLPKYRGAAPIQRAILGGDDVSGVTIMQMDSGLDTGDILLCEREQILPHDTSGSLHDKLANLGAKMIVQYLYNYESITPKAQINDGMTYASKISKAEAKINWNEDAFIIERKIRGYNPFPGAYTFINDKIVKIWCARIAKSKTTLDAGCIIGLQDDALAVSCGNGSVLEILELQLAGEKRKNATLFMQANENMKLTKFALKILE